MKELRSVRRKYRSVYFTTLHIFILCFAIMFNSCGDEGNDNSSKKQPATEISSPSIEGFITINSGGLEGVTVLLEGDLEFATTTDVIGRFTFSEIPHGDYLITPVIENYKFQPENKEIVVNESQLDLINFEGIYIDSIAGTITYNGKGMEGVAITLNGADLVMNVTTDSNGSFTFYNIINGSYKITPSIENYIFHPEFKEIIIDDSGSGKIDFQGVYYGSITGKISYEGNGLSGVTVKLSGDTDQETVTDDDGNYVFNEINNGVYTVSPEYYYYDFEPEYTELIVNDDIVTQIDFEPVYFGLFEDTFDNEASPTYTKSFGSPVVVDHLVPLSDKSLLFNCNGNASPLYYDQILYKFDQLDSPLKDNNYDSYNINVDIYTEGLIGTINTFNIMVNGGNYNTFTFRGSGEFYLDDGYNSFSGSVYSYSDKEKLNINIFYDLLNAKWEFRLNNELVYSNDMRDNPLNYLRITLGNHLGNGIDLNANVYMDNMIISASYQ